MPLPQQSFYIIEKNNKGVIKYYVFNLLSVPSPWRKPVNTSDSLL
jgi:hypothetical protein